MPDPWSYAKDSEHSHQAALFMWAGMAERCGLHVADCLAAYTVPGWAMRESEAAFKGGHDCAVPQLKWLHAIHNQGHGDKVRGGMAKAEGVKAGVYDMFLPVPGSFRGTDPAGGAFCHGFYLELKVGKGKTSDKQDDFGTDMRAAGYATDVAWGWLEARNKLLAYLGLPLYV